MKVSDLIDRSYDLFLYPAGINRPAFDILAGPMTDADLTFVVQGRQSNIPRDSLLEIDSEVIQTNTVSGTGVTVARRGYQGTDAAAHVDGALVLIDPIFTRRSILDTIKTIVGQLYPKGLFRRATDTSQVFSSTDIKTLPAEGRKVLSILTGVSGQWHQLRPGWDYVEFPQFTPLQYQLYRGAASGAALTVVYATDFDTTLITDESVDLDTVEVPREVQPYIPMGVAGYLLQGKETPRLQIEEIRRLISSQSGVAVGATLNVGRAFQAGFDGYVAAEVRRQRELNPTDFEFVR